MRYLLIFKYRTKQINNNMLYLYFKMFEFIKNITYYYINVDDIFIKRYTNAGLHEKCIHLMVQYNLMD